MFGQRGLTGPQGPCRLGSEVGSPDPPGVGLRPLPHSILSEGVTRGAGSPARPTTPQEPQEVGPRSVG